MPDSLKSSSHRSALGYRHIGRLAGSRMYSRRSPLELVLLVSLATTIGLWELHGLLFHVPLSGKWRFFSFAAGLSSALRNLPLGNHRP